VEVLKVASIKDEAKGVRTISVRPYPGNWSGYVPGQFVMVWLPGIDEVPMSVSYLGGDPFTLGITVQDVGEATHALCSLEPGMRIGIRGPYGRGFDLDQHRDSTMIGVCGGVGAASIVTAMEKARMLSFRTVVLAGSRSSDLLMFKDRFASAAESIHYSTDDGTFGEKGLVTSMVEKELSRSRNAVLLVCGPELMMRSVAEIAARYGVEAQYSLERFMKCGIGVCDSCSISGVRVCQDGPVLTQDEVMALPEFGTSHRDRSGRSVPLRECVR
jgi:dihydroorotate dehydrogenase electron transfer subunit